MAVDKATGVTSDAWTAPDPPVEVRRPMLLQSWRDCAFVHWACDPSVLLRHIPKGFDLDLFGGEAWLSLVSFRMPEMRPGALPPIPGLSSAHESHLRTYVRGPDGRRGISMLSLDMSPATGAALGRTGFGLPYWWASIETRRTPASVRYDVRRRAPGAGTAVVELAVHAPRDPSQLTELDHFLTARWILYAGIGSIRAAFDVQHPRWTFREVSPQVFEQSFTDAFGLPAPVEEPIIHFSDGVDARLSWPRLMRS